MNQTSLDSPSSAPATAAPLTIRRSSLRRQILLTALLPLLLPPELLAARQERIAFLAGLEALNRSLAETIGDLYAARLRSVCWRSLAVSSLAMGWPSFTASLMST